MMQTESQKLPAVTWCDCRVGSITDDTIEESAARGTYRPRGGGAAERPYGVARSPRAMMIDPATADSYVLCSKGTDAGSNPTSRSEVRVLLYNE